MPSSETSVQSASQASNTKLSIAPEVLLGLATAPLLFALVSGKAITGALRELGLLSEELFRGDRLPVLNVPSPTPSNPDDRTAT